MVKPAWSEYFFGIACEVSTRASCPRSSCGVVAVGNDNRILATGYNGAPSKMAECLEVGCDIHNDHCMRTIHGEQNLIVTAAKHGIPLKGSKVWVYWKPKNRQTEKNYSVGKGVEERRGLENYPCLVCRNIMIGVGIKEVHLWSVNEDSKIIYS